MRWALFVLTAACLLPACGSGGPGPAPEPTLWNHDPVEPLAGRFFSSRPFLTDVSLWSAPGCGTDQPDDAAHLGDLGVGNGQVFALTGYTCPLNTLHTMIGPNYQKDDVFFSDTASWLEVGGQPVEVTDGRVFRVRGTAVAIARERSAALGLTTVTFAPVGRGPTDPIRTAIVRVLVVENRGASAVADVVLRTDPGNAEAGTRRRRLVGLTPDGIADPTTIELGSLEPGAERVVVMAHALSHAGQGDLDTLAALRARGLDGPLAETIDGWRAWFARAAHLEAPDPMLPDLLDGLLVTVRTQQDAGGGVSPMSEYSRIWTRDLAGPVRLYSRVGLHAEAFATLDYYHTAAAANGGFRNSYRLDAQPVAPAEEPDWDAMGPFSGTTAAEAPSYLPLMAHWYAQASGDHSLVGRFYPFFRLALAGQVADERGLQTFSGDETFRAAMSIANGRHLEYDYPGCCPSANSAFLYVVGARALAAEAAAVGLAGEAADWRAAAAFVRASAEETFWNPDGFWRPFVDRDDPADAQPPWDDVNLKAVWTGYAEPTSDKAVANLKALLQVTDRGNGLMVSPVHPDYEGVLGALIGQDVADGVYTGMNPGYGLYNLAACDHPLAEAGFNALRLAASPTGNFGEYLVYDDFSALQIVYEPSGVQGDYTARYRPWEGGIVADALVYYLTGFEPDAPGRAARLAPRLPNRWPWMRWKRLRVGATRFDLAVDQRGDRVRYAVGPTDGGALTISLAAPLPACEVERVVLDGKRLGPGKYQVVSPFGQTRVVLPAFAIGMGRRVVAEVDCSPIGS